MDIILNEFKPSPIIGHCVEYFWFGRFNINSSGHLSQRVIPNGYVELIIHLSEEHCELFQGVDFSSSPDFTLIGMFSKPYEVKFRKPVDVFGIRFKPEGISNVFGVSASEIKANYEDMANIAGIRFSDFTSKLRELKSVNKMVDYAEKYLLENLRNANINMYYLNYAAEIIRSRKGMISIEESLTCMISSKFINGLLPRWRS